MRNKFLYILIPIFFLVSCEENKFPIYGYVLGDEKNQNLELHIKKTDTIIRFEYKQKNDSLKDINLKYYLKEDMIITDLDTFKKIENSYKTKNLNYNMYQTKRAEIGNKTLVFNKNNGLFASLGFGSDCLFIEDSTITFNVKEFTFKDLYVSLNKME